MLDPQWGVTGILKLLTDMGNGPRASRSEREEKMRESARIHGAPDFNKRTFFRAVVDGQYKLVRWFSPNEYGNPSTVKELLASGDVTLHDLVNDPGEMENIGHPDHPRYDQALIERMLRKLHVLVAHEIGEDRPPFDLDMFGTRDVKYREKER